MKLYIVATPIGNLSDITFRAVEILKSVDIIACEDTRITKRLCKKYDIHTRLISYHKFSERQKSSKILEYLKKGLDIALISDAGTPLICDPGYELIELCRQNNVEIIPVPGVSALITFLSAMPRKHADFYFAGFAPRKVNEIKKLFNEMLYTDIVFYESPNRLLDTMEILKDVRTNAKVAIGRELTKIYEEIIVDSVDKIIEYYKTHTLKGELVVMVFAENSQNLDEAKIMNDIQKLKNQGFSSKDICKILNTLEGVSKNTAYDLIGH